MKRFGKVRLIWIVLLLVGIGFVYPDKQSQVDRRGKITNSVVEKSVAADLGEPAAPSGTLTPWHQSVWTYAIFLAIGFLLLYMWYRSRLHTIETAIQKLKDDLAKQTNAIESTVEHDRALDSELSSIEDQLNLLTRAANLIDLGIVMTDSQGNIEWLNEGFARMYGIDMQQIIKTSGINIVKSSYNPQMGQVLQQCIEKKITLGYQTQVKIHDDEYLWVETRIYPILGDKGELLNLVIVDTDISKQISSEEKLRLANEELKNFAYVVSHDLKAPLRGIGQVSKWLADDYLSALGKEGRELLELLMSRVNRMADLIDGILQYSRVGRKQEKDEEIDLNVFVRELVEIMAPPENIRITIETTLPTLHAGKTRISQLFQNLISNAVKYMDKPEGEIRIGCLDDGVRWKLYVADNGPGIEKKYQEKIFQIFQTLRPRDERESIGVGLSVVRKIVESYGGQIWVESEKNKGCTFYFYFNKKRRHKTAKAS